jgi:Homeodomain-like domain
MPRGPKPRVVVRLTAEELSQLQHLSRLRKAPYAEVLRARILLAAYQHPQWSNVQIARALGCALTTVRKWRARSQPTVCWQEAARSGAPRFFLGNGARPGDGAGVHAAG